MKSAALKLDPYKTEHLLAELAKPNRDLVFIDDGGTPEQPLGDRLVRDYKVHTAVIVPSESYKAFLNKHQDFLSRYPWAGEFHAKEILQGNKAWQSKSDEVRKKAFHLMIGYFHEFVSQVLYIEIGIEQYKLIIEKVREAGHPLLPGSHPDANWDSHQDGARVVLLRHIADRTGFTDKAKPLVVVADDDPKRRNCQSRMFLPENRVVDDSVFYADSKTIPGIQLADLSSYVVNRWYRISARFQEEGTSHPLDPLLATFRRESAGKFRLVLSDASKYEKRRIRNQKKRARRD